MDDEAVEPAREREPSGQGAILRVCYGYVKLDCAAGWAKGRTDARQVAQAQARVKRTLAGSRAAAIRSCCVVSRSS